MTKEQFEEILKKVMEHNEFTPDMTTVEVCDPMDRWTPVDLILREYLNNGGGSAKGFLGITPRDCVEAFDYITENLEEFIANDMISEVGRNNSGFLLWEDYGREM